MSILNSYVAMYLLPIRMHPFSSLQKTQEICTPDRWSVQVRCTSDTLPLERNDCSQSPVIALRAPSHLRFDPAPLAPRWRFLIPRIEVGSYDGPCARSDRRRSHRPAKRDPITFSGFMDS
jgi:hypothetical protein